MRNAVTELSTHAKKNFKTAELDLSGIFCFSIVSN